MIPEAFCASGFILSGAGGPCKTVWVPDLAPEVVRERLNGVDDGTEARRHQ